MAYVSVPYASVRVGCAYCQAQQAKYPLPYSGTGCHYTSSDDNKTSMACAYCSGKRRFEGKMKLPDKILTYSQEKELEKRFYATIVKDYMPDPDDYNLDHVMSHELDDEAYESVDKDLVLADLNDRTRELGVRDYISKILYMKLEKKQVIPKSRSKGTILMPSKLVDMIRLRSHQRVIFVNMFPFDRTVDEDRMAGIPSSFPVDREDFLAGQVPSAFHTYLGERANQYRVSKLSDRGMSRQAQEKEFRITRQYIEDVDIFVFVMAVRRSNKYSEPVLAKDTSIDWAYIQKRAVALEKQLDAFDNKAEDIVTTAFMAPTDLLITCIQSKLVTRPPVLLGVNMTDTSVGEHAHDIASKTPVVSDLEAKAIKGGKVLNIFPVLKHWAPVQLAYETFIGYYRIPFQWPHANAQYKPIPDFYHDIMTFNTRAFLTLEQMTEHHQQILRRQDMRKVTSDIFNVNPEDNFIDIVGDYFGCHYTSKKECKRCKDSLFKTDCAECGRKASE